MLSDSDIKIVEKVLGMPNKGLKEFMAKLEPGALDYLENILNQYEKQLD